MQSLIPFMRSPLYELKFAEIGATFTTYLLLNNPLAFPYVLTTY
jgi:hypothetical protein